MNRLKRLLGVAILLLGVTALGVGGEASKADAYIVTTPYSACNWAPQAPYGEAYLISQINSVRSFWGVPGVCWNNHLGNLAYNLSYSRWDTGVWPWNFNPDAYDPADAWNCMGYATINTDIYHSAEQIIEAFHYPPPYYTQVTNRRYTRVGISYFVDPNGSGAVWIAIVWAGNTSAGIGSC